MKLLLHRNQQQKGVLSKKIAFSLRAKAQLTDEENACIERYNIGGETLYDPKMVNPERHHESALASVLSSNRLNRSITVYSLIHGVEIECKDILEMRAFEEHLKHACTLFKEMLDSAAQFDGEEVIEF